MSTLYELDLHILRMKLASRYYSVQVVNHDGSIESVSFSSTGSEDSVLASLQNLYPTALSITLI